MKFPEAPPPSSGDGAGPGEPDSGAPPAKRRVWLLAVAAVVALAVVGLVTWLVLPDKAGDSSNTSGPTITGEAVKQVLLDNTELAKMLDQPFNEAVSSQVYGGLDAMDDSDTPGECVGVVEVAPTSVYESAGVESYARETWDGTERGDGKVPLHTQVMFVKEAVVALPSAADARALFAEFSQQWKRCDGQAVDQETRTPDPDEPPPLFGSDMHITDVRVSDNVLAASIALDKKSKAPDTRAIGVQGNCLVEVLVAFTGADNPTGSGDPKTSSTEVVQAMTDKISNLS